MAERLLRLWDKKRVGIPDWDGWLFSRGVLKYKNQQWRPENLLQIRKDADKVFQLENELSKLFSFYGLMKISKHLIKKHFHF